MIAIAMLMGAALFGAGFYVGRRDKPVQSAPQRLTKEEEERIEDLSRQWDAMMQFNGRCKR